MPAVPGALASTLWRHLPLGKSRIETLVVISLGLVCSRTVNLSHIAVQFRGAVRLAFWTGCPYRRLQRFFQFVRLDEGWLALALVRLVKLRAPFTLCLDRTNWKLGTKDDRSAVRQGRSGSARRSPRCGRPLPRSPGTGAPSATRVIVR